MDRAARTNSDERRKGRLVIHAGGLRHTAVKHTDEPGTTNQARRRGHVPARFIFWGVGGPMHRPQTRTRRAPTVRPKIYTPQAQKRTGGQGPGPLPTKKFVCNTFAERAEFFGPLSGPKRLGTAQMPMLGNVPNGASFGARKASGFAILGSAWEPGPRSQAAAQVLAEKPAMKCPEAAGPAAVVRA